MLPQDGFRAKRYEWVNFTPIDGLIKWHSLDFCFTPIIGIKFILLVTVYPGFILVFRGPTVASLGRNVWKATSRRRSEAHLPIVLGVSPDISRSRDSFKHRCRFLAMQFYAVIIFCPWFVYLLGYFWGNEVLYPYIYIYRDYKIQANRRIPIDQPAKWNVTRVLITAQFTWRMSSQWM